MVEIIYMFVGALAQLQEADAGELSNWAFSVNGSWKMRIIIGFTMVPCGEVDLIFAELGRIGGIFNNYVYHAVTTPCG